MKEILSCQDKKPPDRPRNASARKKDGLVMNKKKAQFATATAISKSANTNLGVKISKHTISRRLDEINWN